jgi:hypothetical protein
MARKTKVSKYLLAQDHITDQEINELYDFAAELELQLDRFKAYDKKYRALEKVNTKKSEKEKTAITNSCIAVIQKLATVLKDMEERSGAIANLLMKAKGALEEKLDLENK